MTAEYLPIYHELAAMRSPVKDATVGMLVVLPLITGNSIVFEILEVNGATALVEIRYPKGSFGNENRFHRLCPFVADLEKVGQDYIDKLKGHE
jgi:hypothetical protein